MTGTVITATLIRNKKYSYNELVVQGSVSPTDYKFHSFERNIPMVVTSKLADELEELVDIQVLDDGDEIEKPIFRIDRNAQARTAASDGPKKVRMRLVPALETRSVKPKTKTVLPPRMQPRRIG